ncbi:MAG: DUF4373 domain-containing protein [Prevotella sp.]|nr:DUF4373 domain-containing protein [Prevotella sp.]
MARPKKHGLDYFGFDVNFFQDIKIRKLIRYKGIQAVPLYLIVLCHIYRSGYYLEWDEDLPFVLYEQSNLDEDYIMDAILFFVEIGLFSKVMFENYKVLTSKRIQEKYFFAYDQMKRKVNDVYPYLLSLTGVEGDNLDKHLVNSEETLINSEETLINSEETPISSGKIEENKEKENKNKDKDDSQCSSSMSSPSTTIRDREMNLNRFMEFFNRTMLEHNAQIPSIVNITGKRRTAVLARFKEYGKDALRTAVINAATAPFLNGASEKPFVASFDWIFRPNNFPKVLEGNYNHSVTTSNSGHHGSGNNNGYRTSEDIINGAVRIIQELREEGRQPEEELPVV